MSKELEARVESLISLSETKREIGREKYRADKDYSQEEHAVMSMLRSGHVLPPGSDYHAEITEVPAGRLNYKHVVDAMQDKYPKLSNVIEGLKTESRELLVERLSYGKN